MQDKLITSLALSLCFFSTSLLAADDTALVASESVIAESDLLALTDDAVKNSATILTPSQAAIISELTPEEIAQIDGAEDILEALDIPVDDGLVVKIKMMCAVIKDAAGPHWAEYKTVYMATTIGLLAAYVIYLKNRTPVTVAA